MTLPGAHVIPCPHCSAPQEFRAWRSVNGTLQPELRERLFAGELTRLHCGRCGESSRVDYPLLYRDMERGFMIWYLPEGSQPLLELTTTASLLGAVGQRYTLRLTTRWHELLEKIRLFEDGWDDRAFEVVRLLVSRKVRAPEALILYDGRIGIHPGEREVRFAVLREDEELGEATLALDEQMDALLARISRLTSAELPEANRWLRIDQESAPRLLERVLES